MAASGTDRRKQIVVIGIVSPRRQNSTRAIGLVDASVLPSGSRASNRVKYHAHLEALSVQNRLHILSRTDGCPQISRSSVELAHMPTWPDSIRRSS